MNIYETFEEMKRLEGAKPSHQVDENVNLRPDIIEIFKLYSENKFRIAKDSIEEALLNAWV